MTSSTGCGGTFDVEARQREIEGLEAKLGEPDFWERPEEAQRTVGQLKRAKRAVEEWTGRDASCRSLAEMLELAEAEDDPALLGDLSKELDELGRQVAELELHSLLSGEHDRLGAIVSIHPGAGGTESQDWVQMLLRMYMRWRCRNVE